MCKRIFVAIDGSTTARAALVEAIQFASLPGMSLCIGTVLDTGMLSKNSMGMGALFDIDQVKAGMRQAAETLLDDAMAKAKEAGLDPFRILVESDNKRVADMIVEAAGQWDADLIVIGTHGRRGFERMVMGSVAENLVRIATTSLFLVRRKAA
ncbi:universal stress protein [Rhodoferax sp.]|uniref:universal stress protein n=1 Tax=Rhodoferax sp. TaxID=50421 RepID=UPI00273096B3|nr:universal stress protein [Rhodoferax sp.]MDP1530187.1 universal stress protein [Rhodoferax sp.]MDP1945411.1 universal stress protein [Rhodoferax sp.]MDP2443179.1 universal stress protein [Rhodoferax sp.]MDP3191190.1 universal stress protein [Rhodoferax sp.]MDP3335571.1 universal stress protein [Rhodoferax sp.]